jgi:SpoVK/Ycf46/Vps4 family AAA+-type ATPase
MFKKLYLLNLITVIQMFGAASSNDTQHVSLLRPVRLPDDRLTSLSLEFSPQPIQEIAKRLADHTKPLDISCNRALLVGESGTGKSTLARSIAKRANCRIHQFNGTALNGDKYIRSGQVAIDTHLVPIIAMAEQERQVIIIDEFDRLIIADEKEGDTRDRVIHFWQVLDEMLATRNIFFIGTCNKTEDFPVPLEDRLQKDCRHHISFPSTAFRNAALKYLLNIDSSDRTYDASIERASHASDGLSFRSLERIACYALIEADKHGAKIPSRDELLTAIETVRPKKENFLVRTRKASIAFLKDNRDTITVVTSLASLGLGVYQHHQSIKRQEQMQLQQQQFQNETTTRNENFTRQMQENLQAANEQVRKDTQQWQEKYAKEEREQTNNFQLNLLRLNHNNTLELTARQENLQIKLHSENLKNAADAAKWQTWTWLGSTILNAGLNYTINCLVGGKGQTSTPTSSDN